MSPHGSGHQHGARLNPVTLGGGKMDDVMKEKIETTLPLLCDHSFQRGRNVEVAESAVRQSKSFTDQEALTQHLIAS